MLSTKSVYAIKALVYIAINSNKEEYISIKDISKFEAISFKYLEQIIAQLVRGNLLISYRGNNGGYKLSKKISEYNAYEIICVSDKDITKNNVSTEGWSKRFFDDFNNHLKSYLQSITLTDLIKYYEAEIEFGDYCI